jgi:hypothetical protein
MQWHPGYNATLQGSVQASVVFCSKRVSGESKIGIRNHTEEGEGPQTQIPSRTRSQGDWNLNLNLKKEMGGGRCRAT